jgi:hypothetical protein
MRAKPGVTACPHCGGLNGFLTTQKRSVTRVYGWDGESEDSDATVLSETNPRCQDCGKSVRSAIDGVGGDSNAE